MSFAVPRGAVGFDAWDSYIKRRAPAETPWTRMEKERSKKRRDMITETRRRQRGSDVGEEEATYRRRRRRRRRERERWRTRKEQMMIREEKGRCERMKREGTVERRLRARGGSEIEKRRGEEEKKKDTASRLHREGERLRSEPETDELMLETTGGLVLSSV